MSRWLAVVLVAVASASAAADPCARVRTSTPHDGRLEMEVGRRAVIQRDLALAENALVWSSGEALWRIRGDGRGCLEQVSARSRQDASLVDSLRAATVGADVVALTKQSGGLPETPQTFLVHDGAIYATVFRGDAIYRIDLATNALTTFATLPRQSGHFGFALAQRGDNLYVASYGQRFLVEIPFATGTPRTIARGFASGPTAIAVDDTDAYVYVEGARATAGELVKAPLAKRSAGKSKVIATGLVNSDAVLLDGDFLYLRTKQRDGLALARVRRDGTGGAEIVETQLPSPARPAAADVNAVYLDGGDKIVRLEKSRLGR